ncbi:MAG: TetR/AcrR family transcriptional regulator [Micropruina sp.]|nr:TetR/AcrR family transcriptional regulator [Micropruina sp.]
MPRNGAPTRERILDAAERLVIDNGYAATSLDRVIAESHSSKGSFFHHFASKDELARALVERYAAADIAHLETALAEANAASDDAAERVLRFVRSFEDTADELMSAQSSCLYVSVLTERELVERGTSGQVTNAIVAWREGLTGLLQAALPDPPGLDLHDVADHLFVTFEGAFILCRATGDPSHMRRQLRAVRQLYQALLSR